MTYEQTPIKNSKGLGKRSVVAELDKLSTMAILWHVVKRHKLGLVTGYAIVLTILTVAPFTGDLLLSVFK